MYLTIKEKLDKVNLAPTQQDQVNLLRNYGKQYSQFIEYVRMGFDPTFEFDLPPGIPPYTKNTNIPENAGSNLIREFRKLVHVMKGNQHKQLKREMLFIQMLEAVSAQESEILAAIHDGGLFEMYPNISLETIDLAFPNLIVIGETKDDTKSQPVVDKAPAQANYTPHFTDFDTQVVALEEGDNPHRQIQKDVTEEAPYGYKLDGTPKKKPGSRQKKED